MPSSELTPGPEWCIKKLMHSSQNHYLCIQCIRQNCDHWSVSRLMRVSTHQSVIRNCLPGNWCPGQDDALKGGWHLLYMVSTVYGIYSSTVESIYRWLHLPWMPSTVDALQFKACASSASDEFVTLIFTLAQLWHYLWHMGGEWFEGFSSILYQEGHITRWK